MRTLERAMNSEHEAEAVRLALECARTLLAYYAAENGEVAMWTEITPLPDYDAWRRNCSAAWLKHQDALDRFERAFPRLEWTDLVPEELKQQIERNRP